MEAMILAAGGGTRLRPLTDDVPKALVEVGGRPLLGWVMDRITGAGATRIIINTHHHQDQILAYLEQHATEGIEVAVSPEPDGPFDTGGGLFSAAPLFRERGPFILHNVDVLSTIPLGGLVARHTTAGAGKGDPPVASLAVQTRESNRSLLFDDEGLLGWENRGSDRAPEGAHRARASIGEVRRFSFTGIHVVEPRIFDLSERKGTFSIITLYLELAAQGYVLQPIDVSDYAWLDVGTPERLNEAEGRVGEW